ncbi:MAG: hypothetical protein R3C03_01010 [Pirellulaceae bacterium]
MNLQFKNRTSVSTFSTLGFAVAILLATGCNRVDSDLNNTEIPVSDTVSISESEATSNVIQQVEPLNTPGSVVRGYINWLERNEPSKAEQLLSPISAMNFRKFNVSLEAPGSNLAKYQIGEPRYSTNKMDLAYVDCNVNDQINGEEFQTSMTWMVRRINEDWRIVGMAMSMEENKPPQLLSFENLDDIAFIQDFLTGNDATAAE